MRASSVLLDHNAAGASPERYTHIFISSIDPIGLRQEPYGPTTWPGAAPSNAGTTFVSVAPFAPPPARVETPPPPPLAAWQPGHWSWSGGQYVWIAGQIRATARAEHKMGPRLLAARAERLDLDRRALGVGRSQLTALGGVRSARTASIPSNARKPIASRVSSVALPRCGSRTTFCSTRYPGFTIGSPSYTSRPAYPTCPPCSAAINAASSTNVPRAALTTTAPRGSSAMRAAFSQWRVDAPPGALRDST